MPTKLLFLPHCLKPKYIERLKDEGAQKGYQVFVVGGGGAVKKILTKYKKIDTIIGVACADEIKLAMDYTKPIKNQGTEIIAVKLLTDGCKNTDVDVQVVIKTLAP